MSKQKLENILKKNSIPAEPLTKGIVSHGYGRFYTVLGNDGSEYSCVLRGKHRIDPVWKKYSNPVAVGDNVEISIADGQFTIDEIIARRNIFSRKDKKDKGKDRKEDIIAANIDVVVVVQSFYDPSLNLRFADRISVRASFMGMECVLCVNKSDLSSKDYISYIEKYYKNTGFRIFYMSGKTGEGIADFGNYIKQKRMLLIGYSGVGKSTIMNNLFPGLDLHTTEVSEKTGKGRHTTTNVMLKRMEDGTEIIDTPGMREFGIMDMSPYDIGDTFYEFRKFRGECQFHPCTHDHEPGCAIKKMVESEEISEDRYVSYLNILYSVKEYNSKVYSK